MRFVLITRRLLWPQSPQGSSQRSYHLQQALLKWVDIDVVLLAEATYLSASEVRNVLAAGKSGIIKVFADAYDTPPENGLPSGYLGRLQNAVLQIWRLGEKLQINTPLTNWLSEQIHLGHYDGIVVRYSTSLAQINARKFSQIPILFDADDLDWLFLETRSAAWSSTASGRLKNKILARYSKYLGSRIASAATHIWVPSGEDYEQVGLSNCSVLPNIPLPAVPLTTQADTHVIFFVGSFAYAPNVEGVQHFIERIWPEVRKVCPQAELRIAGTGMHPGLEASWNLIPGVRVLGFVENLRPEYEKACFTIIPIYWGAGTKIKILESLAMGRTCVTTNAALRGLDTYIQPGESVLSAATDEAFAEACVQLLVEPELRESLASNGFRVVQRRYSFRIFQREVDSVMEGLGFIPRNGGNA